MKKATELFQSGMGLAGLALGFALVLAALALLAWRLWPAGLPRHGQGLSPAEIAAHYTPALPPLTAPVPVYHLGHSLTGRDMPAMLAQLAGHPWNSQLGWGASLQNHASGAVPGLREENASAAFRSAFEALDSGSYPVVVLTEMIGLREAIRYHNSAEALGQWAARIRAARPDARIYLYETWHPLDEAKDHAGGWAGRLDADLPGLWEAHLLRPVLEAGQGPIWLIPGGQVMAEFDREARAGQLPGFASAQDLFSDAIHFNDIGAYLMALTHYAVIYGRSPEGLPRALQRADGSAATAPGEPQARAMQQLVWRVVRRHPATGLAPEGERS